jgi:uncharacterized protein YjbJ (UPF0337 family)
MNKDQAKGTVKNLIGKVQEEAGKLTGSEAQQAKGLNKQVEGKAQKTFGDVKEVVKDVVKKHWDFPLAHGKRANAVFHGHGYWHSCCAPPGANAGGLEMKIFVAALVFSLLSAFTGVFAVTGLNEISNASISPYTVDVTQPSQKVQQWVNRWAFGFGDAALRLPGRGTGKGPAGGVARQLLFL